MNAPPRPLPLLLLLLAAMAGRSGAALGCHDTNLGWLSDPDRCWVKEINAAFNGQVQLLDQCLFEQNWVRRRCGCARVEGSGVCREDPCAWEEVCTKTNFPLPILVSRKDR